MDAKGGTQTPMSGWTLDPETYEALKAFAAERKLSMNVASTLPIEAMFETQGE